MAPSVRSKKLFLGVRDENNKDRRQFSVLTTLTDGDELFSNQYAKMFTEDEIGNFDVRKQGNTAVLEFTPFDLRSGSYSFSFISYDTKQTVFDSDDFFLGNTVSIATTHVPSTDVGTAKTIFSIPSDTTSGKLLVETTSDDGEHYEYNELNFVYTDTDAYFSEFGKLTISGDFPSGIGTYDVTSDGDIIFTSGLSTSIRTNVIGVSIASSEFTATAQQNLRYANVESLRVSIAASDAPQPVAISSFTATYNTAYYMIQTVGINTITSEKTTQFSEIITLNNNFDATIVEYGQVNDDVDLGEFDANSSILTELFFTPTPDTDIEMTILRHIVTFSDFPTFPESINFNNAEITTGVTVLNQSSNTAFRKDFDLTHREFPIFERRFNGSLDLSNNQVGVDLDRDLIYLPNHYFVTGEKINYRSQGAEFVELTTTLTSDTAGIGTNIVDVVSTASVAINDYIQAPGTGKILLINVGITSVSLASSLTNAINAGVAVTFFRLNEGVDAVSTDNSIGIAQTFIAGVGNTDKLSGDLYVYKKDDLFIGFGTSPIDVIQDVPKLIDLTAAGVGNNHYITSINPNARCLITIDNMIQSPIVSTATTTLLTSDLEIIESTVFIESIENFAAGDLIQIDDEIMKLTATGVGTTSLEFQVDRPFMGSSLQEHTSGAVITRLLGNYNIVANKIYFAEAPYGPIFDPIEGDIDIRSSFQGRVFLRSASPGEDERTYQENYVFDDLQEQFNSRSKDFVLTSNNQAITGISSLNSISLINGLFQNPIDDYELSEELGNTEIQFTGTATSALYDPNNASVPRGGIPLSLGSSEGFGYQPLISAGGTAVVSSAGTIQSIAIGYSGSGYREGIQTIVNVGVQTSSTGIPNIEFIGTASVSNGNIVSIAITNPGIGYTTSDPPKVVFDQPFSYENLNLVYQSPSSGLGTEATIDIVVGQGSSVIDFTIRNYGYAYERGDILTVETGGTTGIPTDSSAPFANFSIIIEDIRNDEFSGWSIGELEKLDDLDNLFNGIERTFPLSINQNRFAILAKSGSSIELSAVLLIFVNDVLQEPNVAYTFEGGSLVQFTEAPVSGSKCRMYFYKGTPDVDVVDVDILETVQKGDTLQIIGDKQQLIQEKRLVKDVFLPDTVKTNNYNSVGVSSDNELLRPVTWCKQREDSFVDGVLVSKSRVSYEPSIYPVSKLIQSVSVGSTQIFVDNVTTIFNQDNENVQPNYVNTVRLIDADANLVRATAVATPGGSGEINTISITNVGQGYIEAPGVSISYPPTGIVTNRATATAFIAGGEVSNIDIDEPGVGYDPQNPPQIIIQAPNPTYDDLREVGYEGDFGIITGVNVGASSTEVFLDLYIPNDSFLREFKFTNPIIDESQIEVGYYLQIKNSLPLTGGVPLVSRRIDGSLIGISTSTDTGLDNIYQAGGVTVGYTTDAYGVGSVQLTRVLVYVTDNTNISTGSSSYFGDFSWGVINVSTSSPVLNEYTVGPDNGVVGLNDTPSIVRINPLRYDNYL